MSSLFDSGVLSSQDRDFAIAAGAIGNLLGRFIGKDGHQIDHPLNQLCLGSGPEEVRSVPVRILCAGGPNKLAAISGALDAGVATMLVTDETTANALLTR
jgi:DNA-binding transcriptional regulator LsrR (DeoR family)